MKLNNVRENVKPRYKLSNKVLKEEDGYYPLIDISTYPAFIQLKILDGVHNCVTVVGKCIFDSNFPIALPLTNDNLD